MRKLEIKTLLTITVKLIATDPSLQCLTWMDTLYKTQIEMFYAFLKQG